MKIRTITSWIVPEKADLLKPMIGKNIFRVGRKIVLVSIVDECFFSLEQLKRVEK